MERSINEVLLLGRVGQDPDVKTIPNGGKFINFSVATSDVWKDKTTGDWREKVEWHRVTVDGGENGNIGAANFAERYLKKGSLVRVRGKLRTREWTDSSGQKRQTTEVYVNRHGIIAGMDFGGKRDIGDDDSVGNV